MLSSMLKLNPEKTEFSIFDSHALLKNLDCHFVRTVGKFMHPSFLVKNLGIWFDAI